MPGPVFRLFQLLTVFDWPTPSKGFIEDIINSESALDFIAQTSSWTFFVPYDEMIEAGWDAEKLEKALNKRGIKTWGGQFTGNTYFFSVKQHKGRMAEAFMNTYSIPMHARSRGAPMPRGLQRELASRTINLGPDDYAELPQPKKKKRSRFSLRKKPRRNFSDFVNEFGDDPDKW